MGKKNRRKQQKKKQQQQQTTKSDIEQEVLSEAINADGIRQLVRQLDKSVGVSSSDSEYEQEMEGLDKILSFDSDTEDSQEVENSVEEFELPLSLLTIGLITAVKEVCVIESHKPGYGPLPEGPIRRALTRVFAFVAARKIYATIEPPSTLLLTDENEVLRSIKLPVPKKVEYFVGWFGSYNLDDIRFVPRYPGLLVSHLLWIYLATDAQLDDIFASGALQGDDSSWFLNRCNVPLLLCNSSYLTNKWSSVLSKHPLQKGSPNSSIKWPVTLTTRSEQLVEMVNDGFRVDPEVYEVFKASEQLCRVMNMSQAEFKTFVGDAGMPVSGTKAEMMARGLEVARNITPTLRKYVHPVYELVDEMKEPVNQGNPIQQSFDGMFRVMAFFQEGVY